MGLNHAKSKNQLAKNGKNLYGVWPLILGLTAVTTVLYVFLGEGGFVPDNRMGQFWNPSRVLLRLGDVWSSSNLGTTAPGHGFVVLAYSAMLESLGASPWLIQRIFHVTLISGGSIGAALVTREFLGRSRIGPAVTGLFWITSSYTVSFLLPSNLYLNVAVAPWLFLACLLGTTTSSQWRWAAAFALAVAAAGYLNPPGLLLATLPLIPLVGYLLWTRESSWAVAFRWSAKAFFVTVFISTYDIYRSVLYKNSYVANLGGTEDIEAIGRSSSWSESLRGLGQWLTYWNPSGSILLKWLQPLVSNPLVILASFVPVIFAFAVVGLTSWRPRFLFGGIMLMSAGLMVGVHPLDHSSPLGVIMSQGYDRVPFLFALRNSYKAGAGLLLAISVLVGFAASWLARGTPDVFSAGRSMGKVSTNVFRWTLGISTRVVGTVMLIGGMIATSSPVWAGGMYARSNQLNEIPEYWQDALRWLDQRESPGQALVIPGGRSSNYRWGSTTNGDLFETFLGGGFILDEPLSQPNPVLANLISEVSRRISSGRYLAGSMTQIARRLGISHIVLRNDTNWSNNGSARPAYFDLLRSDPDLVLEATFGRPGENVIGKNDFSVEASRELEIPPVEIYAVRSFAGTVRAVSKPSVLLSGDGEAWSLLAARGKLDGGNPIRYSGDVTLSELKQELERGASVVITDTNRGRLDLFGRPGSKSLEIFPDAKSIVDLSPNQLLDATIEANPKRVFDGSPKSRFLTGSYRPLSNQAGIRVELNEPSTLHSMAISAVVEPGIRQVKRIEIVTSTGVAIPAEIPNGSADIEFAEQRGVTWFEIRVTEIAGEGLGAWGFNEIEVAGLDLSSKFDVSDDIIRVAEIDSQTFKLLADSDVSYQFQRISNRVLNQEASMRRRFRVATEREYIGSGILVVANQTDIELANLIGLKTFGASTSRFDESLESSALFAFDGSVNTAWSFDSSRIADLNVFFDNQVITTVRLVLDVSSLDVKKLTIELDLGGERISAAVDVLADCTQRRICEVYLDLGSEGSMAKTLAISIRTFSEGSNPGSGKLNVSEVILNGQQNIPFPVLDSERCHDVGASMGGKSQDVKFFAPTYALFRKLPISFGFCKPTLLLPGWHDFISGSEFPLSSLNLELVDRVEPTAVVEATAVVQHQSSSRIDILVNGPKDTILVSGMASSPIWRATADGKNLGPPITIDGQMSWMLPSAGPTLVRIENTAQKTSDWLFWFSFVIFVVSLLIVMLNPRRRSEIDLENRKSLFKPEALPQSGLTFVRRIVNVKSLSIVVSGLLAGVAGVVVSACIVFLASRELLRKRIVGSVAVGLITLAAIATVPPLGPAFDYVTPEWPNIRTLAWISARLGAVVLLTCIAQGIASDDVRGATTSSSDEAELTDQA